MTWSTAQTQPSISDERCSAAAEKCIIYEPKKMIRQRQILPPHPFHEINAMQFMYISVFMWREAALHAVKIAVLRPLSTLLVICGSKAQGQ